MREVKSPGGAYTPLGTPLGGNGHRTSETNLRRCGGAASRASQKSSLLFDYLDGRDVGPQRSVSLTTLSPSVPPVSLVASPASPGSVCTNGDPDLEPRMAQLETLEAKMASIEVSLSTTPRRKKNGSIGSAAGVTAAVVANNGVVGGLGGGLVNSSSMTSVASMASYHRPSLTPGTPLGTPLGTALGTPHAPHHASNNRDFARELDALRNALRDKENLIQSLRGQLMNGSQPPASSPATPATPAAPTWPHVQHHRPPPSEKERRAAEERLGKLRQDVDNKRLAIKNLKMALERLDITDNIDVRIQQAELEYQLGREELNLLSLLEETRNMAALLEEAERARSSQAANTLYSCVGSNARGVLVTVQVQYDPKSPQFGAGPREDAPGLYVHWATDTCGMAKGDRVLEVNGKLVLCKSRDDMHRLLAVSPDPAHLVLLRAAPPEQDKQDLSHLAQLAAERERTAAAERTADNLRADSVRLSHRISYLEDQVAELLSGHGGHGHGHGLSAGPQRSASANVSTVIVTTAGAGSSSPASSPAPLTPSASDVQIYQKGSQVQLVSNLPRLEASLRSKPRDDLASSTSTSASPTVASQSQSHHKLERSRRQSSNLSLARSTNALQALDVFSAESPRGPVQHIRIRQPPSTPDGLASDSDVRRPRRKSEAHGGADLASLSGLGGGGRHYRKHHEYCSSGGEGGHGHGHGSRSEARPASSSSTSRPVPPRKPLRLSLHRAASLQSVESAPPGAGTTPTPTNGATPSLSTSSDKKAAKRNHKGEAPGPPGIPSDAPHPHPFQSALRWTAPSSATASQRVYRSSGNLTSSNEKWC